MPRTTRGTASRQDPMMICLKVDIDTYRGMKEGLGRLLDLFKNEGIRCSIFVSFGPDESGKAIKRILTKKGFLKKMLRTNAAKLYGFRTMLYGTLLPAPRIGTSFPELVKRAVHERHEIGIHAWSHVAWQDDLDRLSEGEIEFQLDSALRAYRKTVGDELSGFAAPAWKINETALRCLLGKTWKYLSMCRGKAPAYPKMGDVVSNIPEIPTTIATLDEILAWDSMTESGALDYLCETPRKGSLNVYTLHAEVEGMAYFAFFERLLKNWKKAGFGFATLGETARNLNRENTKTVEIKQGLVKGRAGEVAFI